ncbi:MAG: putative rRNA methylase [Frankiales bacterium]|nr:putative rRNA methylase [Frankiales bacterium]
MVRHLRLDAELVRRRLARSREQAVELINNGLVEVRGSRATKPASGVEADTPIRVRADRDDPGYASRGAHKLVGALERFGVEVAGKRCLDAGASTGGFTDVLLRRGARQVIAVDVGYGQLVWSLQSDPRVLVQDRTNIRTLRPEDIGGPAELTVADLSFISLELVLPALTACTETDLIPMVKPQFEVGRERLGRGGVVRDPMLRAETVLSVARRAESLGWGTAAVARSPLPGPSGNVEFFLWLRKDAGPVDPEQVHAAVSHPTPGFNEDQQESP